MNKLEFTSNHLVIQTLLESLPNVAEKQTWNITFHHSPLTTHHSPLTMSPPTLPIEIPAFPRCLSVETEQIESGGLYFHSGDHSFLD